MSQFAPVLTSQYYKTLQANQGAMDRGAREMALLNPQLPSETIELAHTLALQIPEFDWTIEVDVLGSHRVTVHFKGASVSLDEPV